MSGMRLEIEGLAELREALRNLPTELTGEASHLIEARGNAAVRRIKANYPPGELRDKTTVAFERTPHGAIATIRNTSRLAFIAENGTQVRHYTTNRGNRHVTGSGPARHAFVPEMLRERRGMNGDLADLLTRKGLLVSDDGR